MSFTCYNIIVFISVVSLNLLLSFLLSISNLFNAHDMMHRKTQYLYHKASIIQVQIIMFGMGAYKHYVFNDVFRYPFPLIVSVGSYARSTGQSGLSRCRLEYQPWRIIRHRPMSAEYQS
jgi:hypothetical protein